ncbi:MAG: tRNA (adenine(22)-N(1))-methyltransferase TrmK [Candidatus Nanoarchaeia archaeon]|nr:tRNA (adenine(22)-N(1))-methyltransferase TrmK [Candidatus Nanoarchaeia archaeon]
MNRTDLVVKHLKEKGEYWVEFEGLKLKILPEVFYYFDSEFLAKNLDISRNAVVLDMGTGSGILAIVASKNAKKVIAADILDRAVECARLNVKRLGLENKIEVIKSNLFENINGKFDIIIFNIPFNPEKEAKDLLEIATFDKDARLLQRFFKEVGNYLKEGGKIILAYASFGRLDILNECIKKQGFRHKIKTTLRIKNNLNDATFYIYEIFR